jgi:hypothetical protein
MKTGMISLPDSYQLPKHFKKDIENVIQDGKISQYHQVGKDSF